MPLVMDERDNGAYSALFSSSSSSSLGSSGLSGGYLEDVLVDFGSKRRRLMLCNDDYHYEWTNDHFTESYWNSVHLTTDELGTTSSSEKTREESISELDDIVGRQGCCPGKTKVVYPFAVVKPGGLEGDVTLSDINKRILKRPARPVRHPVGDFACRRRMSPEEAGISGKAVVALTTIQTHGKGTITIIRTKG